MTIGKYQLIYHTEATSPANDVAAMDGTMVLNTKQHKKLLENDRVERKIVEKFGGSVLLGEENCDFSEFPLDRDVTTVGKAKFVHVRVKGFMLSGIQAKITKEDGGFTIVNLGRAGKTKVNGEVVERALLKNGDLITVGKSTFKFVESRK
ncbi:MAG: FHA domain-containing protein [Candidatus Zixiibacteriota bacterium]|nr:MAG: FHA domain-containing protein [candidate division Zixibacteria bacterium]